MHGPCGLAEAACFRLRRGRWLARVAVEEFLIWFQASADRSFDKTAVQTYRAELERKHLAPSSINVRMAAIRKLATEAADNGLLLPETAAAIRRVRGARRAGQRLGNWLSREQAEQLLHAPDPNTRIGLRDRVLLALLLGAGLRRSEAARLTFEQIQLREGRCVIVDLRGKHNSLRSVPIPDWCKAMVDEWGAAARVGSGPVLLRLDKSGRVWQTRLSGQAIFTVVKAYAMQLGIKLPTTRRYSPPIQHSRDAPGSFWHPSCPPNPVVVAALVGRT